MSHHPAQVTLSQRTRPVPDLVLRLGMSRAPLTPRAGSLHLEFLQGRGLICRSRTAVLYCRHSYFVMKAAKPGSWGTDRIRVGSRPVRTWPASCIIGRDYTLWLAQTANDFARRRSPTRPATIRLSGGTPGPARRGRVGSSDGSGTICFIGPERAQLRARLPPTDNAGPRACP